MKATVKLIPVNSLREQEVLIGHFLQRRKPVLIALLNSDGSVELESDLYSGPEGFGQRLMAGLEQSAIEGPISLCEGSLYVAPLPKEQGLALGRAIRQQMQTCYREMLAA